MTSMQEGDALPTIEKKITQEQIESYAKASGDFNPIHIDHEFAATSQFGSTIAHGMMIAASLSQMLTEAFREQWLQGGRLKIRFRAPVYPGEGITTFGRVKRNQKKDGNLETTCSVGIRKDNGENSITGDAVISVPLGK